MNQSLVTVEEDLGARVEEDLKTVVGKLSEAFPSIRFSKTPDGIYEGKNGDGNVAYIKAQQRGDSLLVRSFATPDRDVPIRKILETLYPNGNSRRITHTPFRQSYNPSEFKVEYS